MGWISGLQECKYHSFFEVGRAGGQAAVSSRVQKIWRVAALAWIFLPRKVRGGNLTSAIFHSQWWVQCTKNHPFLGLEKIGVKRALPKPFHIIWNHKKLLHSEWWGNLMPDSVDHHRSTKLVTVHCSQIDLDKQIASAQLIQKQFVYFPNLSHDPGSRLWN